MSPQPYNYTGLRRHGIDKARTGRPHAKVFEAAKASNRPHVSWMVDNGQHALSAGPAVLDEELYVSRRVRTPRRHMNRTSLTGYYSFISNGDHVWHDSLNEAKALRNLDYRGDIVAIASQPATITFPDGHWHVLDFIALDTSGRQIVIDVKLESQLTRTRVDTQLTATAKACELIGWGYEVHTDLPLQLEMNMEWLEQFKLPRLMPPRANVARLEARAGQPMSVREAAATLAPESLATGRTYLYHLVWARHVEMDLTVRIGDDSAVWVRAA